MRPGKIHVASCEGTPSVDIHADGVNACKVLYYTLFLGIRRTTAFLNAADPSGHQLSFGHVPLGYGRSIIEPGLSLREILPVRLLMAVLASFAAISSTQWIAISATRGIIRTRIFVDCPNVRLYPWSHAVYKSVHTLSP